MKYCINYSNKSHIIDKVDEILIRYDKNKILELFTQFIPAHLNQRVIVQLIEENNIDTIVNNLKKIISIYNENKDIKFDIQLPFYNQKFIEELKDTDLKYFFKAAANSWDKFTSLISQNVSDIYITDELAFELDKVAEIAHKNNIKVRIYPNVAQSRWDKLSDILKFFIRPEDIEMYEPYVDVCEFYGDKAQQIDTYYKIYQEDKKWFGDLQEIIIGLDSKIDSRYIIPRFAEKRIKCGKDCLKGGKCEMCKRILDLSEQLENAHLIVQIDKEKEEDKNA